METSKKIYIIHAKDADQHLGNLKHILNNLKKENRIADYTPIKSTSVEENSFQDIAAGDMVILMLTHDLATDKAVIEQWLIDLKEKQPDCKIAEIIVDNIPYAPHFIAFPADLQPIRSREDMDNVWQSIESTLKDFFPVKVEPKPAAWKKYLPYGVGLAILIFLAIVFWPRNNPATETKVSSSGVVKQIVYDVILLTPGNSKIEVIKAIREITRLGLKDSKELVDTAPQPVKKGIDKKEAEEIKAKLEEAGARVEIKEGDVEELKAERITGISLVEDVSTITGRGTVATVEVKSGSFQIEDKLYINNGRRSFLCTGISKSGSIVDKAVKGEKVQLLIRGISPSEIQKGDSIIAK